jgi:hypothetical protein
MLDNNIWCDEGGGPLPVILDYVYPYRNEQSGAPYHPSLLPEESDDPDSDYEEARHALALERTRDDASGSGKGTVPSPSNSARVIGDDRSGKHEQDLETLLGFFTIVADPRDGSRYMATLWHTMAKVFLQCEEWEHQGLTVSMREHETIEHAVTYLQLKGFTVPEPTRSTKTSYRGYAEPVLGQTTRWRHMGTVFGLDHETGKSEQQRDEEKEDEGDSEEPESDSGGRIRARDGRGDSVTLVTIIIIVSIIIIVGVFRPRR